MPEVVPIAELAGCTERWSRVRACDGAQWNACAGALRAQLAALPKDNRLSWSEDACAIVTEATDASPDVRAGLRLAEFTMVLLDARDQTIKTKPLSGMATADVGAWLNKNGLAEGDAVDQVIAAPDEDTRQTLERWMANGHAMLTHIARRTEGASRPKFDRAQAAMTLAIRLPSRAGEPPRVATVGLGWAADETGAQLPNVFVSVSPGATHQVLSIRQIDSVPQRSAQARTVQQFVTGALAHAYRALDRRWQPRA